MNNEIQQVVDDDYEESSSDDGVGVLYPSESNIIWLTNLISQNNGSTNPSQVGDYFYRCRLEIEGHPDLPEKMTAWFIKDLTTDETGKSLFQVFSGSTYLLKFRYHEIKYLFLSGCTILMFIEGYTGNSLEVLFGISHGEARKIQEYLFNFENQIPFTVVKLLVDMTKDPDQLKKDIVKFIHINNITKDLPIPSSNNSLLKQWDAIIEGTKCHKHVHLLHLLYLCITSTDANIVSTNNNKRNEDSTLGCNTMLCSCFPRQRPNFNDPKEFFRNVEELTSTGIELEPSSSGLATISFSGKCFNLKGHLKLPPLIVDEWTEEKLNNLLRYEMFIKENKLISYIKFMDILIDIEQDVKQLRASRVLQNRLSSDADVANLFNKLGSKFSDPQHDYYRHVKIEIQTHCERKRAIWMTQFYQKYFSNPWAIIGLLAAVIVLSLAAVQAWFAINPRK